MESESIEPTIISSQQNYWPRTNRCALLGWLAGRTPGSRSRQVRSASPRNLSIKQAVVLYEVPVVLPGELGQSVVVEPLAPFVVFFSQLRPS